MKEQLNRKSKQFIQTEHKEYNVHYDISERIDKKTGEVVEKMYEYVDDENYDNDGTDSRASSNEGSEDGVGLGVGEGYDEGTKHFGHLVKKSYFLLS